MSAQPEAAVCACGRPLLTFPGEFDATCAGCRSKPDSCDCALRSGMEPTDPMPDEPWTELGYARRFVSVYGDRLRYVHTWNCWLVWDGKRWAKDETGQAARWAKLIARGMTDIVLAGDDRAFIRDHLPIARRGESSAAVSSVLKLACTEAEVAISHSDLDADPFLLNCANGVLDLRTLQLGPHDPGLLLTKITGAAFEPEATGKAFGGFLARVQPDERMRAFLARLLGHALEGRVVTHILPIFYGAGANGKSTLTNAVCAALGDYAAPADPELLTARTFDAHPTGTADLCGLRLALLHESDAGRRLAEGTVKRLTGGDPIKARHMRENFWTFPPTHTFLMLTNHKPVITGSDDGIWRRIRLVPWDVIIPAEERDEELGDRLALELNVILAWLVTGYADWKANGLDEPEPVMQATEDYRSESDGLGRFLAERCISHGEVKSSELFREWEKFCAEQGEDAGTQKAFSSDLLNRGYDKHDKAAGVFWRGLGLARDEGSGGL